MRPLLLAALAGFLSGCGLDKDPTSGGVDLFAILGLTAAVGAILGALARLRDWSAWVGVLLVPIAAAGAFLEGLSPVADPGRFFTALILFSIIGLAAFLIVGCGKAARNGGFGGGADLGNGGFGGGGTSGGGGASGNW